MEHTEEFIRKIKEYQSKFQMLEQGDGIVAGVSGGADSVCLLSVLKELEQEYDLRICVVHIEHGIRGEESKADAAFVRELAHTFGMEYREFSFDVIAEAKKEHCSVEEMGRRLRYQAFEEIRKKEGLNKIAVAHHQNDQAETVIMNLARGSGIHGLHGILPVRGKIIRPLLSCSRGEIEEYLKRKGLSFRTDKTNLEEEYTRNRVRRKVLPYMEEALNEKTVQHLAQTAELIYEAEACLNRIVNEAYEECLLAAEERREKDQMEKRLAFRMASLLDLEPYLQKEIFMQGIQRLCQKKKDISRTHMEEIRTLLSVGTGKQMVLPHGIRVYREYDKLCMELLNKEKKQDKTWQESGEGIVSLPIARLEKEDSYEEEIIIKGKCYQLGMTLKKNEKSIKFSKKKYTKSFDYDKIERGLCLRYRSAGDFFMLRGEKKQKLKSYFINEKIPRTEREQQLLLADGAHILWIVGRRISEGYKVTENTKQVIEISIMEKEA